MSRRHLALLLLLLVVAASKPARATPRDEASKVVSKLAKQEAEDLLNMLLPFAKRSLEKHGEFFPFGAAMLTSGQIAAVAVKPTGEHPPSQNVIDDLLRAFQAGASARAYTATGMAIDVRTIPPGETQKTDAVEVRIDHASGYSVRVVVPYKLVEHIVTFGTAFSTPGDNAVFLHSVN